MPAFVRNRLVDEVYLPLISDSLARQLGTTGAGKRTDTGGLLLLVSPPGYGKTTLMEYIADRLGLMLVKISGPALGHTVTSLDPADAPNATARREIEKTNFALAVGNNTLLHLDDIQHTSPELLQKFIPLCDATRRVDGVWDGEPCTYDLRGMRFAVCMAGNPYTGSGERFRIPDMLANRADVWNLGDVLTGKEDALALSFVENALTANPVLSPLAARDRADLDLLVRLAAGDPTARADRLARPLPPAELDRALAVLSHLLAVRGGPGGGGGVRNRPGRGRASRRGPGQVTPGRAGHRGAACSRAGAPGVVQRAAPGQGSVRHPRGRRVRVAGHRTRGHGTAAGGLDDAVLELLRQQEQRLGSGQGVVQVHRDGGAVRVGEGDVHPGPGAGGRAFRDLKHGPVRRPQPAQHGLRPAPYRPHVERHEPLLVRRPYFFAVTSAAQTREPVPGRPPMRTRKVM
jgi:hypothetical protein